jgi:hypothetical protein
LSAGSLWEDAAFEPLVGEVDATTALDRVIALSASSIDENVWASVERTTLIGDSGKPATLVAFADRR